jgi:hypothetical protein
MRGRLTFVTPTYIKDLERFCFQRESFERCGIDIPQVAIVHEEDLAAFKKIPFRNSLTLVSTRDVLPPNIEASRTARGYPRKHPLHWVTPKPIHGWMTQQLAKLAAPKVVQTDGYSCLDSEIFFVRRVTEDDFFSPDGRLHLYEIEDERNVEVLDWLIKSMHFLGVPLKGAKTAGYINPFVPMHCRVVLDLQAHIEKRYRMPWADALVKHSMTEYMTYGVFARYINDLNHLIPARPALCLNYWTPDDFDKIEHDFLRQIEEMKAKAVLMNSYVGRQVPEYRAMVEQAWAALRA